MTKSASLRDDISLPGMLLMLAEVILFAVLAVISSRHFGLADGAKITVAYLVAYVVPRIVLRRDRAWSWMSSVILFLLACFLVYLDYKRLTIYTLVDGYSLQEPNVVGDARRYYKWALNQYDGRYEPFKVAFPGFPLMLVGLWKMFGLSVIWPQAMNLMFTLMSVVFTGKLTRRLLSHRVTVSPRYLLAGGMLMTCLLSFYLVMGTAILKEGSVFMAMMIAAFVLSSMASGEEERHHPYRDMALFALACITLGLVRTTYLYFIALGVMLMALPHWRRDWNFSLALLLIAGLSLFLGNQLSYYSFDRHAEIASGGWNMQRYFVVGESQQFYHDLLNYYFLYPVWHKVLMLPLTMSVQFFIPLPWTFYEQPTLVNTVSRFTYGWYVVGGTALFYYLVMSWRRGDNMGVWPWWPALAYAALAYVVAGSVARYLTPFLPLFVPVTMYVLCHVYEGHWRKSFIWWWVVLPFVIAAVLLLCLEIQQGTISSMLHTQSLVDYLRSLGLILQS